MSTIAHRITNWALIVRIRVIRKLGSSVLAVSGKRGERGDSRTVTDVKCAPRHLRTRTNVHVLLVYSRDCYRNANAGFRGPPHNESTLRRVSAGVLLSLSLFLPLSRPGIFFFRFYQLLSLGALLSLATSLSFLFIPVVFALLSPLPSAAERHSMKCHRCPTDCRVKCRRLLIPRLFLRSRGISTLRDGMRRRWHYVVDDKIAAVGEERGNRVINIALESPEL